MKCPKCGNPRMKYDVSRSKYWKKSNQGTSSADVRKDFNAVCKKCGFLQRGDTK